MLKVTAAAMIFHSKIDSSVNIKINGRFMTKISVQKFSFLQNIKATTEFDSTTFLQNQDLRDKILDEKKMNRSP